MNSENIRQMVYAIANGRMASVDIETFANEAAKDIERLTALQAENAKLREAIEAVDDHLQEYMGEWYGVELAYCEGFYYYFANIREDISEVTK